MAAQPLRSGLRLPRVGIPPVASLLPAASLLAPAGLLLAAALLLGACAQYGEPRSGPLEPPPIPARRPAVPGGFEALAAPAAVRGIPQSYRVASGDTVYSIAQQFGLPLRSVIDSNLLEPPFELRPGQSLRLPAPRVHDVVAGDTVYGISRRYGVDMSALVRQNDVAEPYRIRVGQRLILPDPGGTLLASAAPSGARSDAVPTPDSIARLSEGRSVETAPGGPAPGGPAPGGSAVEVAPGGVGAAPPAERPGASAPETLGDEDEAMVARPEGLDEEPEFQAPAGAPAVSTPVPSEESGPARSPGIAAIPSPPPRAGGKFLWPVDGQLISGFGSTGDGLHNDGLNIAAPRGAPILAAENGVVAYVGNELRGFGNLLLIKHRDGWVTAYAHAERFLVARGAAVQRGQPIALVGSSGNVSTPQLHFEVRKGTRALDPEKLLSPRLAASR